MLINVKQNSEMIYSEPDLSVILMTAELYAALERVVQCTIQKKREH